MKFKILPLANNSKFSAFIGKTGMLRIKGKNSKELGLQRGERWASAIDLDEGKKAKYLYLLKIEKEETHIGSKMKFINNSWSFDLNEIIVELNIKKSTKYQIERFEQDSYNGLKIKLE